MEFETRKLQELQSTFENDWIEFRNAQKNRKLVRNISSLCSPSIITTQNNPTIENNKLSQIFIYDTNEVSHETLFDLNFPPMKQQPFSTISADHSISNDSSIIRL